ncbi:cold-shock protein [Streptomyces sp. NBC_00986]|uniref:cold-shock protein n=1 Tax=Streptomyces sp. NBC_00986 TaxID=2903702 RepID=UPI00386987E1|nr:cold shock domain-containing protein [Streptomyces sp. NBC_00986]WSX64535.1 cold shock domain-containing protein [Streptomyces sp. NBC_00986]
MVGRIIRYDDARGYGFIVPRGGGRDVFVHANDFLSDRTLLRPGVLVRFDVCESERGLRAVTVSPVEDERDTEAMSVSEFVREVTDTLTEELPSLPRRQLARVGESLGELARRHGWLAD